MALYIRESDRAEIDAFMAGYDAAELVTRVVALARFGAVAATDERVPVAVVSEDWAPTRSAYCNGARHNCLFPAEGIWLTQHPREISAT